MSSYKFKGKLRGRHNWGTAQLSLFGLFPVNQKINKLNLKVTLNSFAVSLKLFIVIEIYFLIFIYLNYG